MVRFGILVIAAMVGLGCGDSDSEHIPFEDAGSSPIEDAGPDSGENKGAQCVPNHHTSCPCPDGESGWQVCEDDGSRYSHCDCPVDAGPEPDPNAVVLCRLSFDRKDYSCNDLTKIYGIAYYIGEERYDCTAESKPLVSCPDGAVCEVTIPQDSGGYVTWRGYCL